MPLSHPGFQKLSYFAPVVRSLSLARTLEEIMKVVRHAAREITGADGATFVLREGEQCYYADESAISPLWKGQRFPIDLCISGWVMQNSRPAVIENIYEDPRIPIEVYRHTFVRSLTMIPIRTAFPIGAIGTYWAKLHQPSHEEIEVLQALADSVSVAIENVQLYSALDKKVKELERAILAKDQFLMTLSHELRTPLNSILGWADELLTQEIDRPTLQKGLASISRNARHQAEVVNDLLDTTHILSGRLEIDYKHVDLTEALKVVINRLHSVFDSKKLLVHMQVPDEPTPIPGDPSRIQQILSNLLTNSAKFSRTGGKVYVDLVPEVDSIVIRVKDEGEGMSKDFLRRVFEKFLQADGSTTRNHGGLGLGLSLTKYLVEAHGGSIHAESPGLGLGSTFTLRLPRERKSSHMRTGSSSLKMVEKPVLTGIRFLAIDDDEDSRELLAHFLRRQGGEVVTAEGAAEGLNLVPEFNPDFVICDLSMPGEDGYSFIRKLRQWEAAEGKRRPAVAFSAFTELSHESQAISAGFDSFIPKPLDRENFLERLLKIWNSRIS